MLLTDVKNIRLRKKYLSRINKNEMSGLHENRVVWKFHKKSERRIRAGFALLELTIVPNDE